MSKKSKAFIIVFPQSGHLNPLTSMAYELVNKYDYEVIFYGLESNRELIERTGSIFREYKNYDFISTADFSNVDIISVFTKILKTSFKEVPLLLQDYERDRPDVLISDFFSLPCKYLCKLIQKKCANEKSKMPLCVNFSPSFAIKIGVYPTKEMDTELTKRSFGQLLRLLWLILLQIIFSVSYGISVWNPLMFLSERSDLDLVSVFPELQPMKDKLDPQLKYIGCCASESVRKSKEIKDVELKEFLEYFSVINPNYDQEIKTNKKLIYASLGTVFNYNKSVFDRIIEGFKMYELENPSIDAKLIISVGKTCFLKYEDEIKNGKIPKNVLIRESVPQINVLERASLFITHCGMNSASEAIHYGVPVICIPIKADQPFVAHRLADDLKLGLRYDPLKFSSSDLNNGIKQVLNAFSYRERMIELSKISKKYNGGENSAKEVVNSLNEKYKKYS